MDEVGLLLRGWRERAGLSQNALARRMAVNPAYVNRLEHGGRGAHNRDLLESAAAPPGLSAAAPAGRPPPPRWPSARRRAPSPSPRPATAPGRSSASGPPIPPSSLSPTCS